jgi:uncharacterized membrane protein
MSTNVAIDAEPQRWIPQAYPGDAQHPVTPASSRIDSIDLLRGIVMVIMMLDHTRDFIHSAVFQFPPEDLSRTNVAIFFTRWITHYCAPTFVFLAGTGIYLQFSRGKSKSELSKFLITRGLWLIFLELTVIRLVMFFNVEIKFVMMMQVIWVIGVSMVIMGGLIWLPLRAVGVIGVLMIALHNLLDLVPLEAWRFGTPAPSIGIKLWMILHEPGVIPVAGFPGPIILALYPVIPWVGVMAAGFAFGSIYRKSPQDRKRLLIRLGWGATLLFLVLRGINLYGDPSEWERQGRGFIYTVLSFLNTTKYPPSLLFLLMTLGPALLALAVFEDGNKKPATGIRKFFVTFGRVPLFFYILQWPTIHLISLGLHFAFGKPTGWLFQTPMDWNNLGSTVGFNLVVVYVCWVAGVLLLYPLCKWFAGVKQRRRDWWLSYL